MVMIGVCVCVLVCMYVCLCRGEIPSWDLQSLLIKPIQRVFKYPLLLSVLLKNTGRNHLDYRDIRRAHEEMGKVVQDINEIKRRRDLGKLVRCQQIWGWKGELH